MNDMYAIMQPPKIAHDESPPILLFLHGFGSNEHDLMGLAPYIDGRFHLVSVRAALDVGVGYAWYYLYGVPGNLQHDDTSRAQSLHQLIQFIRQLPEKTGNPSSKVYLLGFSQGAVMTLNVALTHPELVDGVVIISGYLDDKVTPTVDSTTLKNLHALVMHGTTDDIIPVHGGRDIRDYLTTTPATLAYYEYPIGHGIHPDALSVINEWLCERVGITAISYSVEFCGSGGCCGGGSCGNDDDDMCDSGGCGGGCCGGGSCGDDDMFSHETH